MLRAGESPKDKKDTSLAVHIKLTEADTIFDSKTPVARSSSGPPNRDLDELSTHSPKGKRRKSRSSSNKSSISSKRLLDSPYIKGFIKRSEVEACLHRMENQRKVAL